MGATSFDLDPLNVSLLRGKPSCHFSWWPVSWRLPPLGTSALPCVGSVNAPGISLSLHTLLGKQKLRSIHCPLSERGSLHIASCPAPSFLVDGVFRPESDDLISTSLPILSLWPFLRPGSRSPQADEEHGSLMQSLSLISWQDVPRSWSLTKQSFVPRLLGSFH